MPSSSSILVFGSVAFDTIMTFPGRFADHIRPEKAHLINVSFTADTCVKRHGGTAGNICYTLVLLGEKPSLFAAVGTDAKEYLTRLEQMGVDCSLVETLTEEPTASAHILTDLADNQITAFHGGAMTAHKGHGIPEAKRTAFAFVILAPDATSRMERHGQELRDAGVEYILDPGQSLPGQTKEGLEALLSGASLTIVNDYELALMREKLSLTSEEELFSKCDRFIVTLGEKGSYGMEKGTLTDVSVVPVQKAIDPTGAGDAYRAGLLKGLAEHATLERCMQFGATAAAYAVECAGTQEHTFTIEAFNQRFAEAFPS